jgi:hypothetical protein
MPVVNMRVRVGGEITPLAGAPDVAVPELEVEVDDPSLLYVIRMTVAVVHGKPICMSLAAERRPDGPPVTRRGLNAIPVDRLVRAAAARSAMKVVNQGPGFVAYGFDPFSDDETSAVVVREMEPRRGRPQDDPKARRELMQKVVDQYRDLLPITGHPKPLIAKSLQISTSYVSALLTQARREGILGPASPGRASEGDPPQPKGE